MITQVAISILTKTYPLDFGGFNEGIKKDHGALLKF